MRENAFVMWQRLLQAKRELGITNFKKSFAIIALMIAAGAPFIPWLVKGSIVKEQSAKSYSMPAQHLTDSLKAQYNQSIASNP